MVKPIYSTGAHTAFYRLLKERVENYFRQTGLSPKGTPAMFRKCGGLLVSFALTYGFILLWGRMPVVYYLLCLLFGIVHALIGLNISHDAVHNAIAETRWINRALSYTFNLIGANEYVWRITHNVVHHNYPNIPEMDPDIDQTPLIRMSPASPRYAMHRYQHWYAPMVYLLFGLYLVFIKDFRILFFMKKLGTRVGVKHPRREYTILWISKVLYLVYMLLIPYLVLGLSWAQILLGFLILQLTLGFVFTVVTAPAHVFLESAYPTPAADGRLPYDWAVQQVETTIDFARDSKWVNAWLGGGNMQVIHHLFPGICHIHSPALSRILEETAVQFGVNYRKTSFGNVLRSHLALLKKLGRENQVIN